MFTPDRVIVRSTAAKDEILVAGSGADGELKNVTINDEALHTQLIATPEFIKNPAFGALEAQAFAAAVAKDAALERGPA